MANSVFVGGNSILFQSSTTLTNAQIKALPDTPVELITAPGANKVLVLVSTVAYLDWTADYTGIDAAGSISVGTGMGGFLFNEGITNLLAFGGDSVAIFLYSQTVVSDTTNGVFGFGPSDAINVPMMVSAYNGVGAAHFGGGNAANTLTLTTAYMVLDLN